MPIHVCMACRVSCCCWRNENESKLNTLRLSDTHSHSLTHTHSHIHLATRCHVRHHSHQAAEWQIELKDSTISETAAECQCGIYSHSHRRGCTERGKGSLMNAHTTRGLMGWLNSNQLNYALLIAVGYGYGYGYNEYGYGNFAWHSISLFVAFVLHFPF